MSPWRWRVIVRDLVWVAMEFEPVGDMVGSPGRGVAGLGLVHTLDH